MSTLRLPGRLLGSMAAAFFAGMLVSSSMAGTTLAPIVLQPGQQVTIIAATPTPVPTPTPTPTPVPCGILQARVDAAPAGSTLDVTGCSYTAGATIAKALTLFGGTISVTSGDGIDVNAAGVTISGVTIHGSNQAFAGVWAHMANGLVVTSSTITDMTYAGIMVLSSNDVRVAGNLVQKIGYTAAAGSNAYGIAISEYQGDPASTRVVVDSNTVTDVPIWHALDIHSGTFVTFSNNTVSGSSRGIFVTTAYGLQASNITLTGNYILSPSPATYNLTPVTLYDVAGIEIDHEAISGWGGQSPTQAKPYYDYASLSTGIVVGAGNTVTP